MPAAAKVSVSISAEDLAWAKKRARTGTTSLSAVVSEALRRQRQAEARAKLLHELGTDDISSADVSAMRAELLGGRKRKGARTLPRPNRKRRQG
jgi:hypothetical protein